MTLLIGIPSFRRPAQLADLLASLAAQADVAAADIAVFVADNDPAGRAAAALCAALASDYRFALSSAVVAESGISAARNRILAEARAQGVRWLAMIDDDETADPRWIAELLAGAERHGAAVVGGPVAYGLPPGGGARLVESGAFPSRNRPSGRVAMLTAANNVLFDCAALDRIGWPGFDLAFGHSGGEDKEYFTRLARAGLTFAWADAARVHEVVCGERRRTSAILRRAFAIGGSDYRIDALHAPGATRLHLAKSLLVLGSAAPLAPALLLPRYRLRMLRRHARACGKLAAAFGRRVHQYGDVIANTG